MKLSELCNTQTGYTARTRLEPDTEGGVPAIQLRDLHGEDDFDPSDAPLYPLGNSIERYWAKPGDILFRSRGERNTAVIIASNSSSAAIAILPLIILRPNTELVDGSYLAWFINQPPAQRYFDQCARGTGLRMIPKGCLDDLEVPVPNLDTQRLIAEIDRLAQRERALMTKLAEKKRKFTSFVLLEQARNAQLHGNEAGHPVARQPSKHTGKSQRTIS